MQTKPVKTTMRWRGSKAGAMSVNPPAGRGPADWSGAFSISPRGRGEDLHYCLSVNCGGIQRAWFFGSVRRCKEYAEVVVHHYDLYRFVVGVPRPADPIRSAGLAFYDAVREAMSAPSRSPYFRCGNDHFRVAEDGSVEAVRNEGREVVARFATETEAIQWSRDQAGTRSSNG